MPRNVTAGSHSKSKNLPPKLLESHRERGGKMGRRDRSGPGESSALEHPQPWVWLPCPPLWSRTWSSLLRGCQSHLQLGYSRITWHDVCNELALGYPIPSLPPASYKPRREPAPRASQDLNHGLGLTEVDVLKQVISPDSLPEDRRSVWWLCLTALAS